MKYKTGLLSRIAPKDEMAPLEKITGYNINLSAYLDFDFYDTVWYWDTHSGEIGKALTGRWLGISHRVGTGMCYWVFNE